MSQTSISRQVFSLSRDSMIYGISVLIGDLVGFLLIPVYTNILGTGGYGVIEVFHTVMTMLGIILAMGFTDAMLRFYSLREDEHGKRTVASTAAVFLTATSLALLVAVELAAGSVSSLIFRETGSFTLEDYARFFRLIFLSAFFKQGITIALTIFRARGSPVKYAAASVSSFLLTVTLNLVFVVGLRWGVEGVLYAGLITSAGMYIVLMASLVRRVGISLSGRDLKAMLLYGLPLVPSGLGAWVLVMADRWILLRLLPAIAPAGLDAAAVGQWVMDQVGVYSLGYKFGTVIQGMVVGPIQLAWLPFLFATARQSNARGTYTRVFTYFLLITLFLALAISALGQELVTAMAAPGFRDAHKVIPLVALSYVLFGAFYQLSAGIYLEGKTKHIAVLVAAAGVLNVVANIALIPYFGIVGSAWATLMGYALLPVAAYFTSQRYYRVSYEWGRVVKMVLVAVLVYIACNLAGSAIGSVATSRWANVFAAGSVKILLLLTYPVMLYLVGFCRPEEIRALKQLARSARARVARSVGRRRP